LVNATNPMNPAKTQRKNFNAIRIQGMYGSRPAKTL